MDKYFDGPGLTMDHWEEKLGMGAMCWPWKVTSLEEMSTPF
jgi:hypothetical protein